jgi:hypothetical protein
MRKIVSLIVFCSFFFPSWSQFENKLSDLGIKGKVKSVIQIEYQVTNYDYKKIKEERRITFVFNQNGYKTEEKYTSPKGDVLYQATFGYSTSGDIVAEKVNNFEYKKNFIKKFTVSPQDITVNIAYDAEAPYLLEKYTLDAKGNVTQKVDYENGEAFRTLKYTYNGAGLLQSESQQMQGSNINFKYQYNGKGWLEKKSEINSSGKALHSQSYTYDKNGNITAEVSAYANDPEKLTLSYKYETDSIGNWYEKQEFMDGRLFSVTKRIILYF